MSLFKFNVANEFARGGYDELYKDCISCSECVNGFQG